MECFAQCWFLFPFGIWPWLLGQGELQFQAVSLETQVNATLTLPVQIFCPTCCAQASKKLNACSHQDLSNLLWAFAKSGSKRCCRIGSANRQVWNATKASKTQRPQQSHLNLVILSHSYMSTCRWTLRSLNADSGFFATAIDHISRASYLAQFSSQGICSLKDLSWFARSPWHHKRYWSPSFLCFPLLPLRGITNLSWAFAIATLPTGLQAWLALGPWKYHSQGFLHLRLCIQFVNIVLVFVCLHGWKRRRSRCSDRFQMILVDVAKIWY